MLAHQPVRETHGRIPGEFPSEEPTYTQTPPSSLPSPQLHKSDDDYEDLTVDDSEESQYDDAGMTPSSSQAASQAASQKATGLLQPPAVPTRSSLRLSAALGDLPQKLLPTNQQVLPSAAPHELYLSSEEDASSSADDFSDFDFDSDVDLSPGSRSSQEDIARLVSLIYAGKPSLIDLPPRTAPSAVPTSPVSPAPSSISQVSSDRAMARTLARRESESRKSVFPPRTSSKSQESVEKHRSEFLGTDPFSSTAKFEEQRKGWISGAMLKKTFNLTRKRSKPVMSHSSGYYHDNMTATDLIDNQDEEKWDEEETSVTRKSQATPREQYLLDQTAPRNRLRTTLSLHRKRNSVIRV